MTAAHTVAVRDSLTYDDGPEEEGAEDGDVQTVILTLLRQSCAQTGTAPGSQRTPL